MPSNAPLKKADIKGHNNVICNRSQIYIPFSLSCRFMVLKFHIFLFACLQINRCGGVKKPCQDVMDYQVLLRIEGNKTPQQQMIRLTALTRPTWGWVGAVSFFFNDFSLGAKVSGNLQTVCRHFLPTFWKKRSEMGNSTGQLNFTALRERGIFESQEQQEDFPHSAQLLYVTPPCQPSADQLFGLPEITLHENINAMSHGDLPVISF